MKPTRLGPLMDLDRFTTAQAPIHATALAELRAGRKRTHWMWFVFPQLRGLGHSAMAHLYGIASLDEARAYLAHPVLGPRLAACTQAVLGHPQTSPAALFGSPDDLKFHSSMTLFALASPNPDSPFHHAIALHCAGRMDPRTKALLNLQ